MTAHRCTGGCHCGNIVLEMELNGEPASYTPRACDCDFCRKHAASYISDPHGKLVVTVQDEADLSRYRQGSGTAEFLVCRRCGVLAAVSYEEEGRLYAACNSKAFGQCGTFGAEAAASPRTLAARRKIERWKEVWFPEVVFKRIDA